MHRLESDDGGVGMEILGVHQTRQSVGHGRNDDECGR
jgi:hypothetical protein